MDFQMRSGDGEERTTTSGTGEGETHTQNTPTHAHIDTDLSDRSTEQTAAVKCGSAPASPFVLRLAS